MIATAVLMMAISQTPVQRADGYRTIGMTTWGARLYISAANQPHSVLIGTTATATACFAYRSTVVIKASGAEVACTWTQDPGVTFAGNTDSINACQITDGAGYDGPGACWMMASGERVDQSPWYIKLLKPGDRSTGVCNGVTTAPGGAIVYPACDADADCVAFGAGTACDLSLDSGDLRHLEQQGCMVLKCQSDAAAYVYVGVEQ